MSGGIFMLKRPKRLVVLQTCVRRPVTSACNRSLVNVWWYICNLTSGGILMPKRLAVHSGLKRLSTVALPFIAKTGSQNERFVKDIPQKRSSVSGQSRCKSEPFLDNAPVV